MLSEYVEKICHASVYDVAVKTPLDRMPRLSQRTENTLWLKREDLQSVFSFKLRGAYNRMSHLTDEERTKGVVAASAGNHAQGVALSAKKMGIPALIVMPKTTPAIKVAAVEAFGATIKLHGNSYDDACSYALDIAKQQDRTFIHPYDDPLVIAGQGTIAKEILEQYNALDEPIYAIFVPVGGGGLIAGIAAYIKSVAPNIKIIGVEPVDAACLKEALAQDERIILEQVGLFADGTAVRQIGVEPFRIARETVDEVITVDSDELCAAIMDIFDDTRSIAEPSGALAVAGVKKYVSYHNLKNKNLVMINSGANINFDRLRHVAERAELGERREVLFAVTIDEQAGSFQQFCQTLSDKAITEFNYRYADTKQAHVFVGVRLNGGDKERQILFDRLDAESYQWTDFSDNEMAKLHIRYMVGGHAAQAEDEQIYRFEFPERPGALLRFLTQIGQRWNISLFHYRNHGAAYGRVLVGIQVSHSDHDEFHQFLDELGYQYWLETDNHAYHLFLK